MFTPTRIDEPELLDEIDPPREDMERSLRDLRRFNRWAGGISIYKRLLRRHGGADSVLDLGTGTSDLLESIDVRFCAGTDIKFDHLLYIRNARIRKVVADARRLPFRDRAFDVITSAHFFHHFSPEENEEMLREALR